MFITVHRSYSSYVPLLFPCHRETWSNVVIPKNELLHANLISHTSYSSNDLWPFWPLPAWNEWKNYYLKGFGCPWEWHAERSILDLASNESKALTAQSTLMAVLLLQVPVRPTHLMSSEVLVEPSRAYNEFAEITPSATPVFVSEVEPSVTTDTPTSQVHMNDIRHFLGDW